MSKFNKYPTYKDVKKFVKEVYEDLNGVINPVLISSRLEIINEDIVSLGTEHNTSFGDNSTVGYMWMTFVQINPNNILTMIDYNCQPFNEFTPRRIHAIMRSFVIRVVVHELMHLNQDICFGDEFIIDGNENDCGKSTETGNEEMSRLWCISHMKELSVMYKNIDLDVLAAKPKFESDHYDFEQYKILKNIRKRFIEFIGMLSGVKILDFVHEFPEHNIYIRINNSLPSDNTPSTLSIFNIEHTLFIGETDLSKETSSKRLLNNLIDLMYSGNKSWGCISFIDPKLKFLVIEIQYLGRSSEQVDVSLHKAEELIPEEIFKSLKEVPKHLRYIND